MSARGLTVLMSLSVLLIAGCNRSNDAITISHAWAPATPPGTTIGTAYMQIEARESDVLIGVSSPIATSAELHRTSYEESMAQMRKVDSVIVAPNAPLKLESGGLHLMLMGLASPLQAGESFDVTLTFKQAGEFTTSVEIVAPNEEHAHH